MKKRKDCEEQIIDIAKKAGKIILKCRARGFKIKTKKDKFDFVTSADTKSESYIIKRLKEEFPNDKILAEETENLLKIKKERVWMIDPLDGTKDFKNGGDGFSVMIGLYNGMRPILGVVYAPAKKAIYYAKRGGGAYIIEKSRTARKIHVKSTNTLEKSRMVTRFIQGEPRPEDLVYNLFKVKKKIQESSVGIKLGLIAKGEADIHINTNFRAHKWDTCAAQIILEEAGGKVTDFKGNKLNYKQNNNKWLDSFVATNKQLHNQVIKKLKNFHSLNKKK